MCKYKNVCLLQTRSRLNQTQRKTTRETELVNLYFEIWNTVSKLRQKNAFRNDLALTGKTRLQEYYRSVENKQKHFNLHKNLICQ